MNYLVRALIEKAGHDGGFENILPSTEHEVVLGSARHSMQVNITQEHDRLLLRFSSSKVTSQLESSFPHFRRQQGLFIVPENNLSIFLKAAATLVQSIPNQVEQHYEQQVQEALASLPSNGTEVERMVRQRIGQQNFRQALMTYWGGACAVTGIDVSDVLRASHIKPWAECATDAERLDVFNGFLLSANLDALFDKGLITFDNQGVLQVSPKISDHQKELLGLKKQLQLRSLATEHLVYLDWHWEHLFSREEGK